jgi:branched-chain amino acid transport system permease protein
VVNWTNFISQCFNGLVLGALLALIASGLTIIYGILGVLNLAHGAMFMLGGYAGWVAYSYSGSFIVAVIAGSLFVMLVGVLMERLIIRHFYARPNEDQLLVTFGLGIVFVETVRFFFGSLSKTAVTCLADGYHAARLHGLSNLSTRSTWHCRRGAARALLRPLPHPHRPDRAGWN